MVLVGYLMKGLLWCPSFVLFGACFIDSQSSCAVCPMLHTAHIACTNAMQAIDWQNPKEWQGGSGWAWLQDDWYR